LDAKSALTAITDAHSESLDEVEEDFVVHYRLMTRFTLDECLGRLRAIFPNLTRSSLHRCLKRRGVGRLRRGLIAERRKRTASPIDGYFWLTVHCGHADRTLPPLFAAIETGSGRCFIDRATTPEFDAARFLGGLCRAGVVKGVTTPKEPP